LLLLPLFPPRFSPSFMDYTLSGELAILAAIPSFSSSRDGVSGGYPIFCFTSDSAGDGRMEWNEFFNEDAAVGSYIPKWNREDLDSRIKGSIEALTTMKEHGFILEEKLDAIRRGFYPCQVRNLLRALLKYPLTGKDVLVVNPSEPWLEALLIAHGVNSVTSTHEKPVIDETHHPKVNFVHVNHLSGEFDGIFKFDDDRTGFSHLGLGRYGDQIDPNADLKRMKALKSYLKPGGMLFFAVPIGPDRIEFNAHRIYGTVRYKLLIEGFTVVKQYPCFDIYPDLESAVKAEFRSRWENQWITILSEPLIDIPSNLSNFPESFFTYVLFIIMVVAVFCLLHNICP